MLALFARRSKTVRNAVDAHRLRFLALAAVFIIVQSLIVILSWAAMNAVDVARAFASGEASYSKVQKAAIISLLEFGASHDPAHFQAYEDQLARALAARDTRLALESARPDFATATEGLVKLGVDRDDTFAMNVAFVLFKDWGPIAKAAAVWRDADALILELRTIGEEVRKAVADRAPHDRIAPLLASATALDRKLTTLERAFAAHMREAARGIGNATLALMALGAVLLVAAGLLAAWRISRKGARSEQRALVSEDRFKGYTDIASDWSCELNETLTITYLSDRFQWATGVPATRVMGHVWTDIARRPWIRMETGSHFDVLAERRPFRVIACATLRPTAPSAIGRSRAAPSAMMRGASRATASPAAT